MHSDWIDISATIKSGMVHWPDDPPVDIEQIRSIERGDDANVSHLSMGSHTGTHMDAPYHFLNNGEGIDHLPFDATIGKARVIEIHDRTSIKPDEVKAHDIQPGERILFKTFNSQRCWITDTFVTDFIYISGEAAEFLAERKIKTVGVDYLSVGGFHIDGKRTHQALLKAGIWIIEGLNLSQVMPGEYELICLPLKILHGDGAPARAILRKNNGGDHGI
jgi:arylformamidase